MSRYTGSLYWVRLTHAQRGLLYVVSIKSWWRYLEIAGGLITSGGNEKIVLWLDEDITGLWLSFANEMNVK